MAFFNSVSKNHNEQIYNHDVVDIIIKNTKITKFKYYFS